MTLAFNGASTGAGGMDTGSMPANNSLYIYAIYNPSLVTWSTLGTTAGSGSSVYGGSHMPAGYTASALIWSGITNGSSNFVGFNQYQNRIYLVSPVTVLNTSTIASTFTSFSIASAVPVNAQLVSGMVGTNYTGANPSIQACFLASSTSGANLQGWSGNATSHTYQGFSGGAVYRDLLILTAQTLYYYLATGLNNATVTVTDYSI